MLTVTLDSTSKTPIYEQLYLKIKFLIKSGELLSGEKLPSERGLAENLQISRNTVYMAYAQLTSEGYIESRPKIGYFVSEINNFRSSPAKENITENIIKNTSEKNIKYDFSPSSLDTGSFPYLTWERLYKSCMRDNGKELFLLGDKQGDYNLRRSIAKHLYEFRGFSPCPDNIIVGAGASYLLQLLHQLLPQASAIAMENPTYPQAHKIFSSFGRKICPIELDEKGMSATMLRESGADTAYLTPSHQYPVGTVMSISRRLEIASWSSEKPERYIIEDDHDSEFRYKGKPIPSMKENDEADNVIYLGTFSRTIAPAIRIGFMVLPEILLTVYKEKLSFYASTVPRLEQAVLAKFISDGYYERHINKCRKIYKSRHDALLSALRIFSDKIAVYGENAGVHIAVKFKTSLSEKELCFVADNAGISLTGLSRYIIGSRKQKEYPVVLIGYGNMREDDIGSGIKKLYEVLKPSL